MVAVVILFSVADAQADDLSDIRRACIERANLHTGIHWIEECFQEGFTAEPFHVTLTPVAPGAGIVGLGPGFGLTPRIRHLEFLMLGKAVISNDGSTLAELQSTFALPTRGIHLVDPSRSPIEKHGLFEVGRHPEYNQLDAKMSVTLGISRLGAREQDFYGLGPDTTLANHATYGLISTEPFADINDPLASWSSIGFRFSFVTPRVTSSINNGAPQLRAVYNDTSAPGSISRADFLHYEPYVVFHVPPYRSYVTDVRVAYAFYHDTASSAFSFQRLSATSVTTVPLWLPSSGTPSHRSWYANGICPSLRSGTRCSLGDITLSAAVSMAYHAASSEPPFYLDPTLGGTDISGADTLRGFVDYRFRGPNSALFQVDYRRPIWGPLGLLSFYDRGMVALRPSEISFSQMRQDFGLGFFIRAGNHEVFRFYVGFGTGEPLNPKAKFPSSF